MRFDTNQFKKDMKLWKISNRHACEYDFEMWVKIRAVNSDQAEILIEQSVKWFRNQRKTHLAGGIHSFG